VATPTNPVSVLLSAARRRALRRTLPFDLTAADIHIPLTCPVLGVPLYRAIGAAAQGPNSPTLDRIKPELGYVRGNVRVISSRANQIKSDATPAELLQVACYYQVNT
jgi:hypothetical protein